MSFYQQPDENKVDKLFEDYTRVIRRRRKAQEDSSENTNKIRKLEKQEANLQEQILQKLDRLISAEAKKAKSERHFCKKPFELPSGNPPKVIRMMNNIALQQQKIDDADATLLIAMSETATSVLSAVLLAAQYGIEDKLRIMPLWETAVANKRAGIIALDLLSCESFRNYLKYHNNTLSAELGYSDLGRFIGQLQAGGIVMSNTKITVRGNIATFNAKNGTKFQVHFYDTHGLALGRGGGQMTVKEILEYQNPDGTHNGSTFEESWQGEHNQLFGGDPRTVQNLFSQYLNILIQKRVEAKKTDPCFEGKNWKLLQKFGNSIEQYYTGTLQNKKRYNLYLQMILGVNTIAKTGQRKITRSAKPTSVNDTRAISHNAMAQNISSSEMNLLGIGHAVQKLNIDEKRQLEELFVTSPHVRAALKMTFLPRELFESAGQFAQKEYSSRMPQQDREEKLHAKWVKDFISKAQGDFNDAGHFLEKLARIETILQEKEKKGEITETNSVVAEASEVGIKPFETSNLETRANLQNLHGTRIKKLSVLKKLIDTFGEMSFDAETLDGGSFDESTCLAMLKVGQLEIPARVLKQAFSYQKGQKSAALSLAKELLDLDQGLKEISIGVAEIYKAAG